MKINLSNHLLVASLALLACATAAQGAVPIPITNAGFEDPVLAEGSYPTTIPNWTQGKYDVSAPTVWISGSSGAGVFNVSTAEYTGGTAPEGDNMGYLTAAPGFDTGVNQVLSATLQADATYDLSAAVGNPFIYNGGAAGNYRIELLAGGVLLQSASGPSPADDTTFTTASLTYNSGAAPAQLGLPLEIRLLAVDFPTDEEVDFDNVQLTVTLANPIANPGGPYFLPTVGGSLSLNGSGSHPSGSQTITLYEWDLDNDGDFDETINGAMPAAISSEDLQSIHGMIEGANTVKLRVTDSAAKSATAQGTVTLYAPLAQGDRWWDGPQTTGATDGVSQGGAGTWSTAATNWDPGVGFPAPVPWNNANNDNAILGGAGGTVTLGEAINLKDLTFEDINASQTITGHTLNFSAGGSITSQLNGFNREFKIESAITGSPDVRVRGSDQNKQLTFDATGTQTLGVITNPYFDGAGDKARLNLRGSTTGNTIAGITYQKGTSPSMHYGYTYKQGTGTWTINGNVEQGRIFTEGGTLFINGKFTSLYQGFGVALPSGFKLGGQMHYYMGDARFGRLTVGSGAILAPGNPSVGGGVGTITLEAQENRADSWFLQMNSGAIYEWQVGASATDVIHMTRVARDRQMNIGDIILKILDAGGAPANGTVQLPVFTYDAGVTRTIGAVTFDTSALGPEWNIGTLALTDDGAGTIYLTGLSKAGGTNTYGTWLAGYPGVGAMTGFTDDPDGDGNGNGLENFFGTDPSVFTAGVIAGTKTGNTFTFTHPQNATPASDITAAYQWSTDLATFTAGGVANGGTTVSFSPAPNTPTAGTTTVTATVTGTPLDKLFVRVAANQAAAQ